jgi:hypothetical protein
MPNPADMTIAAFSKWVVAQLKERHADVAHTEGHGPACGCKACDQATDSRYHLSLGLAHGKYQAKALINGCPTESASGGTMEEALDTLAVKLASKP